MGQRHAGAWLASLCCALALTPLLWPHRRITSVGAELSGEEVSPVMQFYSWDGVTKVGPELPEPSIITWDPALQVAALAYLRQVQLFRWVGARRADVLGGARGGGDGIRRWWRCF